MAWYSILPPQLIQVESWAVRIFFLLGLITIVPWAILIIVDASIYLFRLLLWELPWIGGRARGQQRPRAPSLNERPDGQRRAFGLRGVEADGSEGGRDIACGKNGDTGKENVVPGGDARAHSSAEGELKLRVAAGM